MYPRIDLPPIQEPTIPINYELPSIYNTERYELAFPTEQRMWIRERDGGYSNMPLFDEDNNFIGFDKTPVITHVHHITPQFFFKMHYGEQKAKDMMHHPLNGISLDPTTHNMLHCNWIDQYREAYYSMPPTYKATNTLEDYVQWQVDQGCPFWVDTWDRYFMAISTIKTVEFMSKTGTFPFADKWKKVVHQAYAELWANAPLLVNRIYEEI